MQVEGRLGGMYIPILLYRCVRFMREHDGRLSLGACVCVCVCECVCV